MITIKVTIIYALPNRQTILFTTLLKGSNVKDAILKSGILSLYDIDLNKNQIGIYGKIVKLTDIISNNDRIEIYRPLITNFKKIKKQIIYNK